jgi:hypothetical protein
VVCACSKSPDKKEIGYVMLNISQSSNMKVDVDINDFTLRISDSYSDVFKERISDLPEQIPLPVGTYNIEVYSMEFSEPKFEMPFYSGKTTVEIEADKTHDVSLVCSQGNAGIKLVWTSGFSQYHTYQAQIYSNEGYLNYISTEERTGYFLPGTVSISILADGLTINGGTITLAAMDLVTAIMRPVAVETGDLTIKISIDETENNRTVDVLVDPDYVLVEPNGETNPYTIAQAIEHQGENDIWITGYVVGAKPSSGYDFSNPEAWLATNIVLADDVDETDDRKVIFVELGSGTYRTNLNLLDHSDYLHRKILIKGNLLAYQSRAGLRNLAGFSFP